MGTKEDLEKELKTYFGYDTFRPHQKEIVTHLLNQRDVVAILPTGSGKSLCFQLPAVIASGTTIVISPLIALMQDQVYQLVHQGISATVLNSSLSAADRYDIQQNLDQYKLVYVSPERFSDPAFVSDLKSANIAQFVIDEAHCISQWGHAFRPEYRRLNQLKVQFPKLPIVALTATATPDVVKDIQSQLSLPNPEVIISSFDRPNLTIRIQQRDQGRQQVLRFLDRYKNESGVIYCSTRKGVDRLYEALLERGHSVERYHAGLPDAQRSWSQKAFVNDDVKIMVATVAFGMGINKLDVRFVCHMDMPKNMEQYYQEIGRAGRDQLPAECYLLFSTRDAILQKQFSQDIDDPFIKQQLNRKTDMIFAFCQSAVCRRVELLRYFGEDYGKESCGNCDNCLDQVDFIDGTIISQKILSCVVRVHQRFGVSYVVDVLYGAKTQTIEQRRHDRLSTYGLLKDMKKSQIRTYIYALINMGYLMVTEGEYPILRCTPAANKVLFQKETVKFREQVETKAEKKSKVTADLGDYHQSVYEALVSWRRTVAEEKGVPAYVIFHNKALKEMARILPKTTSELLAVNGVGEKKIEQFGDAVCGVVKELVSLGGR